MSDFKQWYESQDGDVCHDYDEGLKIWNASRTALVGEVEPVAWCLRYNDPRFGPINSNPSMCKPELEEMECVTSGRVSIENLFAAEAITAAHAKGREEGLLAAITACEKLAKITNSPVGGYCAAAIEKLLGEKK